MVEEVVRPTGTLEASRTFQGTPSELIPERALSEHELLARMTTSPEDILWNMSGGTPESRTRAFMLGLGGGGYDAAGMAYGAGVAFKYSGGNPYATATGGVLGLIGGNEMRNMMARLNTPLSVASSSLEEIPPRDRPFAVAGESMAHGATGILAPWFAMAHGVKPTSHAFKTLFNYIEKHPLRSTFWELMGAGGSATGEGIAEQNWPGNWAARTIAGVGGGVAGTASLYRTISSGARELYMTARRAISPEARQKEAAAVIQDIIRVSGGDPSKTIELFDLVSPIFRDDQGRITLAGTAAQKTGDIGLIRIENTLRARSPVVHLEGQTEFRGAAMREYRRAQDQLLEFIRVFYQSDDPAAIQAVAEAERRLSSISIEKWLNMAQSLKDYRVKQTKSPINRRGRHGQIMFEITDEVMRVARKHEDELWAKVDHDMEMTIPEVASGHRDGPIKEAYTYWRTRLDPSQEFPKEIENHLSLYPGFRLDEDGVPVPIESRLRHPADRYPRHKVVTDVDEEGNPITYVEGPAFASAGELIRFRSNMLALARGMRDSPVENKWILADLYSSFARAAHDELEMAWSSIPEDLTKSMVGWSEKKKAYDAARMFSAEFHDRFTRAFAGIIHDTGPMGRNRTLPEVVAAKALDGKLEAHPVHFRQLREAAEFAKQVPAPDNIMDEYATQMLQTQEAYILRIAEDPRFYSKETGEINADALSSFIQLESDLLADFPHLASKLKNKVTAERFLNNARSLKAADDTFALRSEPIRRVLKTDDPLFALEEIMNSSTRPSQLRDLAHRARLYDRQPENKDKAHTAQGALRSLIFEWAVRKATKGNQFSFAALDQVMNERMGAIKGAPSLITYMRREKLMDTHDIINWNDMILEATKREISMMTQERLDELYSQGDLFSDFVLRVIGANLGSMDILATGAGAPIVMAHAGSRAARLLFNRIPRGKVAQIIETAMLDDDLMLELLKTPTTPRERMQIVTGTHAYLLEHGFIDPLITLKGQLEDVYEDF